jgi:hypothetical protein
MKGEETASQAKGFYDIDLFGRRIMKLRHEL